MAPDNGATYDPITALAAREVFALINKDAPYPPSDEPPDHYGAYGSVIAEFRMLHRQAQDHWARGESCDPWYDSGLLWDGYRQEEGKTDYQLLDELVRKIGGLPASKAGKIEYLTTLAPITGTELMNKKIPPTRHFVKDIIRTGLCFFIGQPGVGKTPALVQLAIAYATGGLWLGIFRVPKIKVAYIGPEYDEGDTLNTIMQSTGGRANLDNLLIFTVENFVGPNSEAEAMQLIDDLVRIHQVEAIIIDLFTGFLPPEKFKQNAYRGDYREFLAYHRAALSYTISIVGAWHGTKRDANPATMYNGGQGFWGSAGGGRLVMYQDDTDQVKLYTQLRGSKAMTYSLTEAFIAGCRIWATVEGSEPEPAFGSDVHRAVYYVVKEHAPLNGISPKTIYSLVKPELEKNVSEAYVRKCISVLTKRGLLRAIGDGYVVRTGRSEGSRGTGDTGGTQGSEGSEGTENDFDEIGPFSDPIVPSPIPLPIPSDSVSASGESSTDPSDPLRSPNAWDRIPSDRRFYLRMYMRGNKDSDQEAARSICDEYGVDFDVLRKEPS
jgi:AAA domain-containing protein